LEVWAYCLMTNHIHLIAFPHQQDSLARALAAAHTRYSRLINRRTGKGGHLWQGRFLSCPLDDEYLIIAARYIELNPVRAGLAAKAADWPWSSARAHLERVEDRLLTGASWPGAVAPAKASGRDGATAPSSACPPAIPGRRARRSQKGEGSRSPLPEASGQRRPPAPLPPSGDAGFCFFGGPGPRLRSQRRKEAGAEMSFGEVGGRPGAGGTERSAAQRRDGGPRLNRANGRGGRRRPPGRERGGAGREPRAGARRRAEGRGWPGDGPEPRAGRPTRRRTGARPPPPPPPPSAPRVFFFNHDTNSFAPSKQLRRASQRGRSPRQQGSAADHQTFFP
jgi:hypothetical protein